MNEREAFQLLTLASARDGRTVTQAVAKVWAVDLAAVYIEDAVEALTLHYRESDKWVMPAHIIACVARVKDRRAREARIRRQLEPAAPREVPTGDGYAIYRAAVDGLKHGGQS